MTTSINITESKQLILCFFSNSSLVLFSNTDSFIIVNF